MYTVYCRDRGSCRCRDHGHVHVGLGGAAAGHVVASAGVNTAANYAADQTMKKPVDAYVAQLESGANTQGVGAQVLAPTVLPDGTKQFVLKAQVTPWEVSPGNTVEAWTYNGTVPGPTIKVQPGDHVLVVLDNELPESTAIHFHGIQVPTRWTVFPTSPSPP